MIKRTSNTPATTQKSDTSPDPVSPDSPHSERSGRSQPAQPQKRSRLWMWFCGFLVAGMLIVAIVSGSVWGWLSTLKISANPVTTPVPVTTLNIQRSANYAELSYTIHNAQYATSFADDAIRPGQGIIRLNMTVANKSKDSISVVYYDIARLLAPRVSPIAPTNVHLSVGPQPASSETGWIDFSVSQQIPLDTIQLQLGSTTSGESLVTIPFHGAYNPVQYADRTAPQSLTINYTFPYNQPHLLIYHLTSVDIRYAYKGMQAKASQQIYVLNFRVDNPNGADVSPGFSYDYLRMVLNSNQRTPFDNTLPYTFKHGSQGTSGSVAFSAPAGLKSFTVEFLTQYGGGGSSYDVTL